VKDLSFTKMRGTSIEVTTIGVPNCVTHLQLGLGFAQTTNCAITEMTGTSFEDARSDYRATRICVCVCNIMIPLFRVMFLVHLFPCIMQLSL
jgi:hypothetical protein